MDLECGNITKLILPAIRISLASEMNERYKLNQQEIADRLGIAQVAVSKYLNGRYSAQVRKATKMISEKGLTRDLARRAAAATSPDSVNEMINALCAKIASDNMVV